MKPESQKSDAPEPAAKLEKTPPGQTGEAEESARKGLSYVFKIAPADPKNSFEFEDTADK
jgi:hypothetical protein